MKRTNPCIVLFCFIRDVCVYACANVFSCVAQDTALRFLSFVLVGFLQQNQLIAGLKLEDGGATFMPWNG